MNLECLEEKVCLDNNNNPYFVLIQPNITAIHAYYTYDVVPKEYYYYSEPYSDSYYAGIKLYVPSPFRYSIPLTPGAKIPDPPPPEIFKLDPRHLYGPVIR